MEVNATGLHTVFCITAVILIAATLEHSVRN